MAFTRPTLSNLIERIRADFDTRLQGASSRLARSFLDVVARTMGAAMSNLYGYMSWLADQRMVDLAEAEYLARHARIWLTDGRKAATPASGIATATGANGVVIPAGAVLVRVDGARFTVAEAVTIAGGSASLSIEAEEAGITGNSVAGTALTFASPIVGAQAVALVDGSGLGGGAEEEGDEDLRARVLQRIRNAPKGGSTSDYERWMLEVAGVTRCWPKPLYLGAGTVGIFFVLDGRADIIPLEADVDQVQAYIDTVRPVTANVTVMAPVPQDIDFLIRIVPDTPDIRAAVAAELADLFTRDAEPGGTMWRSREIEAISAAAGEAHHELMLPSLDQAMGPGVMARLGNVEFSA